MKKKREDPQPKTHPALNGKHYSKLETANLVSIVTFFDRLFGTNI